MPRRRFALPNRPDSSPWIRAHTRLPSALNVAVTDCLIAKAELGEIFYQVIFERKVLVVPSSRRPSTSGDAVSAPNSAKTEC